MAWRWKTPARFSTERRDAQSAGDTEVRHGHWDQAGKRTLEVQVSAHGIHVTWWGLAQAAVHWRLGLLQTVQPITHIASMAHTAPCVLGQKSRRAPFSDWEDPLCGPPHPAAWLPSCSLGQYSGSQHAHCSPLGGHLHRGCGPGSSSRHPRSLAGRHRRPQCLPGCRWHAHCSRHAHPDTGPPLGQGESGWAR